MVFAITFGRNSIGSLVEATKDRGGLTKDKDENQDTENDE